MYNKLCSILVVVALFITIIIGIIYRQSYTNITAQPNPLENFSVALWDVNIGPPNLMDILRDELPESQFIIRAKSLGQIDYVYKAKKQLVEVLEVYKGDELEVGDVIWVVAGGPLFFEVMTANMGFVNVMEANQEYLIFLEEKIETMNKNEVVYGVPGFIISPIFSYNDYDHEILSVSEDNRYVPYKEVKDNEFFVSSEEALQALMNLKHDLLQLYPRN